jgi:hypothetical protein
LWKHSGTRSGVLGFVVQILTGRGGTVGAPVGALTDRELGGKCGPEVVSMWRGKRVSVVLMTYAEATSIRRVIVDFLGTHVVDEVVVVNNNAQAGTSEQVALTPAREVHEARQGYGYATRRGLAEASGDLIVLAEPDGTFVAQDILKLLAYSADFDAVFGTRTTRHLIWRGANMSMPLKWGNWAVAKLMSVLFRTCHLSDVGCTYKLFTRDTVECVLPQLTIAGSQLGPEIMLRTILSGRRYVEVPVNYMPRVGVSSVTGQMRKAVWLGIQMVALILKIRIQTIGRRHRSPMRDRRATVRPRNAPVWERREAPLGSVGTLNHPSPFGAAKYFEFTPEQSARTSKTQAHSLAR